jgi:hypothetical protein
MFRQLKDLFEPEAHQPLAEKPYSNSQRKVYLLRVGMSINEENFEIIFNYLGEKNLITCPCQISWVYLNFV